MRDISAWPAIKTVAHRLNLSKTYIAMLLDEGKLRGVKTELGWLIDPDSVDAYEGAREAKRQEARR
jgi:excisionase family DNA binding protein